MSVLLSRRTRHDVNLWVVPLKMSVGAVLLFAITLTPDMLAAYHYIHLPNWFTMGGIDDARAILSAMLGCVSTVLALIFSVALLVLSMVANLFGPRLLYRFVQDWVTQFCIGIFMGAFIYVFLCFLVTHADEHSSFIPQTCLITSWFVVLGAFGFLVFYSHRVAALIQNPDAIGRIVNDLRTAAGREREAYARQGDAARDDARVEALHATHTVIASPGSGYMQDVDRKRLIDAAVKADALILMPFRPGQFVLQGEPLALVAPADCAASLRSVIEHGISLGHHRVLSQDLEFGVAQIVEIAIRALSPAINDTFTGVACVDLLGEALAILAAAPEQTGRLYDDAGQLRLVVRPVAVPRMIRQAFDQIRQAAADNPAVLIRLLSTIGRLTPMMDAKAERATLLEEAAAVWETAIARPLAGIDRDDIAAAWEKTRSALAASLKSDAVAMPGLEGREMVPLHGIEPPGV